MAGGDFGPTEAHSTGDVPSDVFDELLATDGSAVRARSGRSWLNGLLWLLSLVPTVALGLLVSMAVRVRLDDGVWPVRNQPDPKELGVHNTVTVAAILVSFVVVVLVPLLALGAYFLRRRGSVPVVPPVLAVAGLAVLFVVLAADIGGLGEWIGD